MVTNLHLTRFWCTEISVCRFTIGCSSGGQAGGRGVAGPVFDQTSHAPLLFLFFSLPPLFFFPLRYVLYGKAKCDILIF